MLFNCIYVIVITYNKLQYSNPILYMLFSCIYVIVIMYTNDTDTWTCTHTQTYRLTNQAHKETHTDIHACTQTHKHTHIARQINRDTNTQCFKLTSCSSNLISSSCTYVWSPDDNYIICNHSNNTFLSCLATRRQERENSGQTCSMISLGGNPLALLGLRMASSGILPLIICDCIIISV